MDPREVDAAPLWAAGPDDTSPEIRRLQVEHYRRMQPWEKWRLVQQLNELADALALAGLRERYAAAEATELRYRLLVLKHGPDLIRSAYGWTGDG